MQTIGQKAVMTMLKRRGIVGQVGRIHHYPIAYLPLYVLQDNFSNKGEFIALSPLGGLRREGSVWRTCGQAWPTLYVAKGKVSSYQKTEARTTVELITALPSGIAHKLQAICYDSALSSAVIGEEAIIATLKPPLHSKVMLNAMIFPLRQTWPSIVPIYAVRGLVQRPATLYAWRKLLEEDIASLRPWMDVLHAHAIGTYHRSASELLYWAHFPPDAQTHDLAQRFIACMYHAYVRVMFNDALEALGYADNPLLEADINPVIDAFKSNGYELTPSQHECVETLSRMLKRPYQLRALLFGETGTGKTLVSFCLATMALEAGVNVLYLAPTRVLAQQQMESFRRIAGGVVQDEAIRMWTGPRKEIGKGKAIYFATHAAFNLKEKFGMIIIDEEQKFSAKQRAMLLDADDGARAHVIRVSATPSPLTWELADCGLIESVQLTRQQPRIVTQIYTYEERMIAYRKACELAGNRPIAVICPYIGGRDNVIEKSGDAHAQYGTLSEALAFWHAFGDHSRRLYVAFGGMEGELEALMADGGAGAVLHSTNIMETGLNLPVKVLIINKGESFGLGQLHQMRGRLTRLMPDEVGYCIVISGAPQNSPSTKRLSLLVHYDTALKINEAQHAGQARTVPSETPGALRTRPSLADYVTEDEIAAMADHMLRRRPSQSETVLGELFGVSPMHMLM